MDSFVGKDLLLWHCVFPFAIPSLNFLQLTLSTVREPSENNAVRLYLKVVHLYEILIQQ